MTDNQIIQKEPFAVEVEEGKTYFWCTCPHSSKQPFCDGSHNNTDFAPIAFTAEKSQTVYVCGCKASDSMPFCDGAHQDL
ncbi:MAG: CDGSH iron-sulfur domain-containing protein [Sphingomonadales bacterium]